ncbi:MAG TPA: hypothetical protein VGI28_04180 [Stellaceae bacterium]
MTDRLTLARALEEGGIARNAAEHIATEIFDAIHDNTATKADLGGVKTELLFRIETGKAELLLRLSQLEHRMTRFGSGMVVVTGIILAAIRYLPHR